VPVLLPGGESSADAVAELKVRLVEWAGGYTTLGRGEGGWWNGERIVTDENIVFFVVGPADMKSRIEELVRVEFRQQEAFVSRW
jgi:hypothetical protein